MKIIVLHGEDTAKSYVRIKQFVEVAKTRNWEVTYFENSSQGIEENVSKVSLFGSERFFVVKDVKILGKRDLEWIKKKSVNLPGTLIIYNEGILAKNILKSLPDNTKIEEFKLPKLIWTFLENIYPGNSDKVVKDFHRLIVREPPEFIFSLIAKQLRDLFWMASNPESTKFELWKISKLQSQGKRFNSNLLKLLIEKLAVIDFEAKTSKADLVSSLDLMFVKYLQ